MLFRVDRCVNIIPCVKPLVPVEINELCDPHHGIRVYSEESSFLDGPDMNTKSIVEGGTEVKDNGGADESNSGLHRAPGKWAGVRRPFPAPSHRNAKALVCTLTLLIAAVDFSLPANINIATLYFICVVLLIWTRSVKWLWTCTAIFILLTFAGIAYPTPIHALTWIEWFNRSMIALALAITAVPVHLRLRLNNAVELAMAERDRAQRALQESHANLEGRVQERTRELQASEQSLRQLSARLISSQDQERRHIARELHDSVGQYLSHSKMVLEDWLRKSHATESELIGISQIKDSLDKCLTETRTISHLLHPPLLDELGFGSAARAYVDGFSRRSGIKVTLDILRDMKRLPPAFELVLFRILQESLTNVLRHAQSPAVDIQVEAGSNQIVLLIRDHGKGMPPEFVERFNTIGEGGGVGLIGMRERALELHGNLRIESSEHGTLVRATLPLVVADDSEKQSTADRIGGFVRMDSPVSDDCNGARAGGTGISEER